MFNLNIKSLIIFLLPISGLAQVDFLTTDNNEPKFLNQNNFIQKINNDSNYIEINKKHSQILGRHKDPKELLEISKLSLSLRKFGWKLLTLPSLRFWIKIIYPKSTTSHFKDKNAVAFTIDDGFCGEDNTKGCMIKEVRELFKSYDAQATFFVTGNHCINTNKYQVDLLLKDGHEISNHNMFDWKYNRYSNKDFEYDLLITKKILSHYQSEASKWYRAPFGKLSQNMQLVLKKYDMIHVLPDVFAHDTFIPDPKWIAKHILKRVKPGSIILIHMPERGLREWNFEAMRLTLIGLKEKGLKVQTLSQMNN
tara:strand:- start:937 stop:1863 length:927 start_codon:yes stop_codon:yes gene_type:complete